MREQPKRMLRASAIARRLAEEEQADTLHRLRATTKEATSERDARAAQKGIARGSVGHPYAPPMELVPLATI
jgi:hypothetical protein